MASVNPAGAGIPNRGNQELPWRAAGLTERQAAAHLIDRLSFGPRQGDLERVLAVGLSAWLERQLERGHEDDPALAQRLERLDAWRMSAVEIRAAFPDPGLVRRRLERAGTDQEPGSRSNVRAYYREHGLRTPRELLAQLTAHKLLRAIYAENQLAELLADFWFNHFNVALQDKSARTFLLTYERDAIRPHVLGSFADLLTATAKHPAMLLYLDNASSRAEAGRRTSADPRPGRARRGASAGVARAPVRRSTGLNENYARELMELHTLGVDGGFGQPDVIEVARAFTGWTVMPPRELGGAERMLELLARASSSVVIEDEFVFNPAFHDAERKVVLGHELAAGRGIEDGLAVLDLLARAPATARQIARKLAVRLVADEPPVELVARLADTFVREHGQVAPVVRALVRSSEFWAASARQQKIKSPLELAVSAVRATGALVRSTRGLAEWVGKMGQPLYAHEAPTGYPDRATAWVNTGSLLNRMNFGLGLALGRVAGVTIDLAADRAANEPESIAEALRLYGARLMPEREQDAAFGQLMPLVHEAELAQRLDQAAARHAPAGAAPADDDDPAAATEETEETEEAEGAGAAPPPRPDQATLARVVGVLLGSPSFQRR